MRCTLCGNENPGTNRFCGMCGAVLLPPGAPRTSNEGASQASGARDNPPQPRAAVPVAEEPATISGPSFLGLNQPSSTGSGRRAHGSHHERSSRNLDYLLEDDEEPRGHAGKVFVILAALALAAGLGYLRWSHQGLSSLLSTTKKPPAAVQSAESPQPAADGGTAPIPTDSAPAPTASAPASSPAAASAPAQGAGSAGTESAPANDSAAKASSGNPPGAAADTTAAGREPTAAPATSQTGNAKADGAKEEPKSAPDAAAPEANDDNTEAEAAPVPAPKPRAVAKPTPTRAFDQITEAEKYIYGRGGARQDCDRGMRMLRPAAEQANARAMISLGALYSTGVCAPRDLPTAYRWFALALRKDPENQPLQENLKRLWAQMTAPERQLAIKLSQ